MKLLELFKELSIHPKNAEELKGLILQLAIEGRLTRKWRKSNPEVEPANELVKKIIPEKTRLIKSRKLKPRNISAIKDTQILKYTIPQTWAWLNFSEVVFFQEGPGIRKWQFRESGVKLLNVQNIVGDKLILSNTDKFVEEKEFIEKYQHFKVEEGDLLFASSGGSWGKSAWFIDPGYSVMMNTSMIRMCFYCKEWYPDYLKTFVSSSFFKKQLSVQLVGMQPNFGSTHLSRIYIPIPPLQEQKVIVDIVNNLFKEVEKLEEQTKLRVQLKENFVTSSLKQLTTGETEKEWALLQQHFKSFFNTQTSVKKLRESILQLAVQGKLTTKWRKEHPDIEPASVLLERIKAEKARLIKEKKIKKEKPLPEITPEEVPFELPEGWVWCRFQDIISDIEAGRSPRCLPEKAEDNQWGVIKVSAISWGAFDAEENKALPIDAELFEDKEIKAGDFILTRANTSELIAKSVVVQNNVRQKLLLNDKTLRFKFSGHTSIHYVNLYNNGTQARNHYKEVSTGTSNSMQNISRDKIKLLKFPLPPHEEQKAIVAKVSSLMALCDNMTSEIGKYIKQLEGVMQSSLNEVFDPKPLRD